VEVFRRLYQRQVREFVVYPLDEALEKGLKPVFWRDAQVDGWAITDDGFVVECFVRAEHDETKRGKRRARYRAPFAFSIARICWSKIIWFALCHSSTGSATRSKIDGLSISLRRRDV
jgi:hypothetical protein